MNKISKNQTLLVVCIGLILSFGIGFYTGNGFIFLSNTQAGEQVDMTTFWKVWNTLNEKYVSASSTKSISDTDKMYGAISGLVESLGDPYTVFMTPKEKSHFNETIEGVFEGVGMEVGIQDDHLIVVAPLKNSPAQKAGIEKGDIILSIDGKDTTKMKVEEAVSLIRGPKGSVVTLSIQKKDTSKTVEIKVTRDKIVVPTLETEIINDVFVIRLYSFGASATSEFKNALQQYTKSNKHKLILDLRGNPGGYLDAAVDISSWFLPTGKVVVSEDFGAGKDQKVFRSKGYNIIGNYKTQMVVLVDEGSASASEIVAGALQEHGVAKLVGVKTFGKGSVQELINVTPDTSLKVTIARWLTPNGNSISAGGLKPDVEVKFDSELFKKTQRDTQLQKALGILK